MSGAALCEWGPPDTFGAGAQGGNGDYLDGLGPRTQDFPEGNVEACPVCHGPGKLAETGSTPATG